MKNVLLKVSQDRVVDLIGIPDLIIAQNAVQSGCVVYSLDCDFTHLKKIIGLEIIE